MCDAREVDMSSGSFFAARSSTSTSSSLFFMREALAPVSANSIYLVNDFL
jgi:hypothetical protein